ncbi:will decrease acetylation isoform 1-T2 [Glossina fuscipes fuscipes]
MSVQSNHHTTSPLCSGNKSKKSKNDILRSSVTSLLKQKNFVGSEKFRKSDIVLLQNKKGFVLQKMLEADMHGGNSFLYSNVLCLTNNYHMVDQQFGRFSQFVESQPDELNAELKRFYAPMLCHLYLELIKSRESKGAVDLMRKYAHLVAPVETYEAPFATKINGCSVPPHESSGMEGSWQNLNIRYVEEAFADEDPELDYFMKLVQKLSACQKLDLIESDADIVQFRSSKYEIHTNEEVVKALRNFLEKRGHVLILHLIVSWIHVRILDNEVRNLSEEMVFMPTEDTLEDEDEDLEQIKAKIHISNSCSNNERPKRSAEDLPEVIIKSETETDSSSSKDCRYSVRQCLKTIKDCREQIYKSYLDFPRIFNISDKGQGLSCASLDPYECHIATGFNSSVIQLWQVDQHSTRGKNLYNRFSKTYCRWELNNFTLDEDEMLLNIKRLHRDDDQQETYYRDQYFSKKYEDNSYNAYGGVFLRGHGSGVTDIKFSSHHPLLFSTSKDNSMRCWRADSFDCAGIYRGHRYPIWCLDESPVGMYVATGSKDLTARLWSLEKEFPLITYAGHTQDVECVAFHPNGAYIATGSADFTVRLWCVTSGKLMRVFADCKQPICSLAFSPDGKMLAAGGEESKIRIFDLAAGFQLNELKDHSSTVASIAWNTNGRFLASACRDGTLRVWDVKKLLPISSENSSSSSSSTSPSSNNLNRLLALPSNCQRLLKVTFSNNDTICCLGAS